MEAKFADRVAAGLADAVGAVVEPFEGVHVLPEHLAGVVGQRDLLLALEGLGSGVGLVVARPVAGVTHQADEVCLGDRDLTAQVCDVGLDLGAHLAQLLGGPGRLVVADRE